MKLQKLCTEYFNIFIYYPLRCSLFYNIVNFQQVLLIQSCSRYGCYGRWTNAEGRSEVELTKDSFDMAGVVAAKLNAKAQQEDAEKAKVNFPILTYRFVMNF